MSRNVPFICVICGQLVKNRLDIHKPCLLAIREDIMRRARRPKDPTQDEILAAIDKVTRDIMGVGDEPDVPEELN